MRIVSNPGGKMFGNSEARLNGDIVITYNMPSIDSKGVAEIHFVNLLKALTNKFSDYSSYVFTAFLPDSFEFRVGVDSLVLVKGYINERQYNRRAKSVGGVGHPRIMMDTTVISSGDNGLKKADGEMFIIGCSNPIIIDKEFIKTEEEEITYEFSLTLADGEEHKLKLFFSEGLDAILIDNFSVQPINMKGQSRFCYNQVEYSTKNCKVTSSSIRVQIAVDDPKFLMRKYGDIITTKLLEGADKDLTSESIQSEICRFTQSFSIGCFSYYFMQLAQAQLKHIVCPQFALVLAGDVKEECVEVAKEYIMRSGANSMKISQRNI
jgi:hypothetical protein